MTAQPEGYVDDIPVSGRDRPRPTLTVVRHDLRFYGKTNHIRVACDPCDWAMWLDEDHDLPDLITLYAQHAGLEAAKTLVIETLAKYGNEHDAAAEVTRLTEGWDDPACVACGSASAHREALNILVDGVEQPGQFYCVDLIACGDRINAKAQVKM